jgi:hypothetical protein
MKIPGRIKTGLAMLLLLSGAEASGGYYIQVCGVTDRARNYIGSAPGLEQAKREARRACAGKSASPARCSAPVCQRAFQPTKVSELPARERARLNERAKGVGKPAARPAPSSPAPVYRRCQHDYQCPGGGNSCIAGNCSKAGFSCNQESDCPGPRNGCVAGTCRLEETVCSSETDCLGPGNRCIGGSCVIP